MNSAEQRTAKIYAFPGRQRMQSPADRTALLEQEASAFSKVEFGSGWYHDDAIAESGKKRFRVLG